MQARSDSENIKVNAMLKILKTPEGKKFLIAVAIIFVIAVSIVSKAAFQGVEDQYNLPMEQWSVSLFIIQGAWVAIYSLMFTVVGSLPFGFYFLGPKDDRG
jgi:ABC-type multidrug transport system permease subunit